MPKTLDPIKNKIDFWLFQTPSNYKYNIENVEAIKAFFEKMKLRNNKIVIEFRDRSWWKVIDQIENIGIVFCSVGAPDLPNNIINTNNTVYVRLHGSKEWCNYVYSKRELDSILLKIKRLKA